MTTHTGPGGDGGTDRPAPVAPAHGELDEATGSAPVPVGANGGDTGRRRAVRLADGAWLGGVCTGLSAHLGVPVLVFRLSFVALFCTQFIGALIYAVLWLVLPTATRSQAPGLEAHSRAGMRPSSSGPQAADVASLIALGTLGIGMVWLVQTTPWAVPLGIFWPVTAACAGAAMVWRQADQGRLNPGASRTWLDRLLAGGGWPAVLRIVAGLGLMAIAMTMIFFAQGSWELLSQVLAMTALALAGLAVLLAPWVARSRSALDEARRARAQADARADVAAHLHDSVLQTLALVQKQSHDSRAVEAIARRQERELRRWLYGDEADDTTLKAALTSAAAEVEDEHSVPVEIVVVGDHELTTGLRALVQAAREAMVNAAKHSGADVIDTYGEVDGDTVEVFVRDRGRGFDLDTIAEDRQGVRGSIINRMQRHGGQARIRTSPDDGTEVRLEMET
ncbi:MAG TPA: PspC domain-containing protein [Candidatus Avipropionibacterium avicola]|uniref:PspC domain-containing protein n=1 Tax=Candidatus Avipropionibacterium avicola TaxID=2840701 RepID=A0A9D1GXC5_9ACTN|nr:PspC domain-containing protein [Candidatus Avipropionibacterium avicola]